MDNIHLNKLIPSLSSARKVMPVGQRQNTSHQNVPKQALKKRKKNKKKKEDPEYKRTSYRGKATGNTYGAQPSEKNKTLKEPLPKRKIDIRV